MTRPATPGVTAIPACHAVPVISSRAGVAAAIVQPLLHPWLDSPKPRYPIKISGITIMNGSINTTAARTASRAMIPAV